MYLILGINFFSFNISGFYFNYIKKKSKALIFLINWNHIFKFQQFNEIFTIIGPNYEFIFWRLMDL